MKIHPRHTWDLDIEAAKTLQEKLAGKLILKGSPSRRARVIAGADVSYSRKSDMVYAAVVVMDLEQMEILETARFKARASFPYVPGYLTLREGPVLIKAFEKLKLVPDAVIFDGQGVAHPRGLGIASHLGLWLEVPSIGCAKSRLVGEHEEPDMSRGSRKPLRFQGRIVGYVLRTRRGVKPVYVSPGHRIGMDSATAVVMKAGAGPRIPEPVRRAHIEVNRMRKEVEG